VGKTRLAEELGVRVVGRGGRLLRGQYHRESGTAFDAWVQALHPVLAGLSADELAQLVGPHWGLLSLISPDMVDPAAAQPLTKQVENGLLSPADQRQRLYNAVVHLLRNLAAERPLMLLLDDLHWAHGLDLLVHVARSLGSLRALVVATYRPYDLAARQDVSAGLEDLTRQGIARPMRLSPLSQEETASLARLWIGWQQAERLGVALWRATGGNPFLVRETLRSLGQSREGTTGRVGSRDGNTTGIRLPDSARYCPRARAPSRSPGPGGLDPG
jgi:predicted ATPase